VQEVTWAEYRGNGLKILGKVKTQKKPSLGREGKRDKGKGVARPERRVTMGREKKGGESEGKKKVF